MRLAWLSGAVGVAVLCTGGALLCTGGALLRHTAPAVDQGAVVYSGSYVPLTGVHMSAAYASTINLSFDHPLRRHDHLLSGSLTLAAGAAMLGAAGLARRQEPPA